MKQGQVERRETNYIRHATQCLIGSFEVATGKIITPSVSDTRKEEDFVAHIKNTVNLDPDAQWIFIVDQLNTHKSAGLVDYVAQVCGHEGGLGKKGKDGIQKDMASRMRFLADENHKIRFVYTPKHASWLNQIEIWFSIISRKLLKRLSVPSKEELKGKILKFIEYFNLTSAKTFKWNYRGKALTT